MAKLTTKNIYLSLLLLAAAPVWTACDDDEASDTPKTQDAGRAARAGRGGSGEAGAAAGKAGGSAGKGAGGASGGKASSDSCEGPKGCYSCDPQESTHYLNHCTESECEPFDNAARLPLLEDGKLPPLP